MLVATALLAAAAVVAAARGPMWRAAIVVSPGVVATALVYAFPRASYAWPAFVILAPAALVAALTTRR